MEPNQELDDWMNAVVEDSGKKIEQSSVYLSLHTNCWKKAPQVALQLGIAMLLDKPIVLIAFDDEPVPANLQKAAFAIERVKRGDEAAMKRAVEKLLSAVRPH